MSESVRHGMLALEVERYSQNNWINPLIAHHRSRWLTAKASSQFVDGDYIRGKNLPGLIESVLFRVTGDIARLGW